MTVSRTRCLRHFSDHVLSTVAKRFGLGAYSARAANVGLAAIEARQDFCQKHVSVGMNAWICQNTVADRDAHITSTAGWFIVNLAKLLSKSTAHPRGGRDHEVPRITSGNSSGQRMPQAHQQLDDLLCLYQHRIRMFENDRFP